MDPRLVKLFGEGLTGRSSAVVGVVDDDLTAALEKVPDEFLAAVRDYLAECHRLGRLFACDLDERCGATRAVDAPRVK